jgi:hypothetical protein
MFSKQGFFTVCLVILAALLITGCTTPTPVAVTGVTLNHATMTLIAGGATGTLVKTVAPADATDKSVTWSSSATAVATVSVNGVVTPLTAGTTTITVTTVDGSKTATCAVTVTSVVAIATAAIAGVTAPVTGATPVATITATTAYTATIAWSGSPVTFAGGTIYTATITITPKVGYTLTGVAANFFTVAGAAATNAANSGVVTAVFPATAIAVTVVTLAVIPGVTAPLTGATPVATITATTQYTGTVTWSPVAATFAGATVYTATITLTAKAGYTLTGVAANFFTVADATTDTNPINSGVVTAVFPATAAPVIATASTIANAAVAPTVAVTGTNFKATIAASDLTVGVGTTTLILGTVTYVSATHITVAFTGTAAAGVVTIQAKTSAFTPAAGAASNTLTVTVPAAEDTTAPTATLTAPEAGDRTALVVTFNEALNALTLAITDINFLLASAKNDAVGTPVAISVASVGSSVSWNNTNVNAPVATITIPSTTFVRSRIVRLNFVTDHVQDVKGNAILTATNVDATVVDTTAPTVVVGTGTKTLSATSAQITFSEDIFITTPAVGLFAGAATDTPDTITAPAVVGAVVTLTFPAATFATTVASVVDYTPLTVGNAANLKDAAGNEVVAFTDKVLATGF